MNLKDIMNFFNNKNKELRKAIRSENDYLVKKIINEGVNVNYCGPDLLEKFISLFKGCYDEYHATPLVVSSQYGRAKYLKTLIDAGEDINQTDIGEWNVLIITSANGYTECTKILIEAGTNIYHVSKEGFTALTIATKYKHTECVKIIKEQMARDIYFLGLGHDIIGHIIMNYI